MPVELKYLAASAVHVIMDSNSTVIDNASNDSMDISTKLLMGSSLSMGTRISCMGAAVVSLILLLLSYTFTKKVKGTMLGKLMKSYCILALLAIFAYIFHTLMEYVIPANNAICSTTIYFTFYMYLGALISKVLFLFHIGYIFYNSYKMVLKDTTASQIFRLKVGYILTITIVPLIMILIMIIRNHVLHEIKFVAGNRCIYSGDRDRFTVITINIFIVCTHLFGVLIIILLIFLLRNAYKTQKAVGQDVKNLFRIALGIVVAFGTAWIVYAFHPLYAPVAPLVFYSTLGIENLVIILVFFYNNKILTKIKMYIMTLKCHDRHVTVANDIV